MALWCFVGIQEVDTEARGEKGREGKKDGGECGIRSCRRMNRRRKMVGSSPSQKREREMQRYI